MPTRLNTSLSFRDNARQAMEFYHSVFGDDLSLNAFAAASRCRSNRHPGVTPSACASTSSA